MSKPKAPKPPDPVATANAQTQSNIQTGTNNSYLNNVNQVTPYGNVSYDVTGAGPNGVPRWTQTTTESPNQAQIRGLGEQQDIALGNLGLEQTSKIADILGTPYTPGRLDIAGTLGNYGEDVTDRTKALLDRGVGDWARRGQEDLNSTLAAQGINLGSDAFTRAQQDWQGGVANAYAANELSARQQGQADRGQALSELLQGFNTNTSLEQLQRQTPINEINALRSSQLLSPINPGQPNQYGIAGTDIAGINNSAYQNQLAAYQQQMSGRNALLGGLASLGGAAIGAPWWGK